MSLLARSTVLALLCSAATASAAPWTYRGTLKDGGVPANGRYDIRLSLLDAGGAKSLVYPLTFSGVEVKNGAFAVDVDFGTDLTQFGALKLKTEVAQGGSGFVALGEPKAFDAKAALGSVCWDTAGNAGTNPTTDFLGTTDAQSLVMRANNQRILLLDPTTNGANVVSGSGSNLVESTKQGQTIAGGGDTRNVCGASFNESCRNEIDDEFGTIGGGRGNEIIAGNYSTIGGGFDNSIQQESATISGGEQNTSNGLGSSILGGKGNLNSATYGAVAGGRQNQAYGDYAIVAGGYNNCAGGTQSFAGGGRAYVRAGDWTSVSACGGYRSDNSGDEGTFVWADSQAADFVSTGPNQFLVRADGGVGINGTPFEAGLEMNVFGTTPFDGFVEFALIPKPSLNGNTGERIELGVGKGGAGTNDASFRIAHRNNSGGYFERLLLNSTGSVEIRSSTSVATQGVSMAAGAGSWSSLSDRNVKTAIAPTDTRALLDKLVAMPVSEWSYVAQGEGVRHIGPMAQDFAAAFGIGENDTTISTVDADGVALAAIQGLNAKLEAELQQSRDQNAQLQTQLEQLATRLAALEAAKEH